MSNDEWGRYVKHVIGDDKHVKVAARVGVAQPTIGRWLKGQVPDAPSVAALAKACGRSVPEAFVAAGLLAVDEVGRSLSPTSRRLLAALFADAPLDDPPRPDAKVRHQA